MNRIEAATRLLGAAIVLIAVYLAPSAALAHGSHAHEGSQLGINRHTINAAVVIGRDVASDRETVKKEVSATRENPKKEGPACAVGCCSMGQGCCHGMLAVAPESSPSVRPERLTLFYDAPFQSGVDPEAPPKPPKSLV